jgi:hypothetical protein
VKTGSEGEWLSERRAAYTRLPKTTNLYIFTLKTVTKMFFETPESFPVFDVAHPKKLKFFYVSEHRTMSLLTFATFFEVCMVQGNRRGAQPSASDCLAEVGRLSWMEIMDALVVHMK